jgi:hypothetical protein
VSDASNRVVIPMPGPSIDPPQDPAELIERAVHGTLTPGESAELDRLTAADPELASELERARKEHDAMTTLVSTPKDRASGDPLPPFDFDRARRTIERKIRKERRVLLALTGWVGITPPLLIAISWPNTDWALVAWSTLLPASPVLIWAVYRWREAAAFRRAIDAGPDDDVPGLESAWERHIRRSRAEFTAMGACIALVFLALVVWAIELIDKGAWPVVPFALVGAGVMGYHGVRRMWTRRGREAHEREIAGLDETTDETR